MRQQSKRRQSRQQWKQPAKARAEHHRSLRQQRERLRNERHRTTQALTEANKQLRQKAARPTPLKAHRGWLPLTWCAGARIRLRAVSRVLPVLADWLGVGKTPCPQTVLNWVLRLSVVCLPSGTLLQGAARHLRPFPTGLLWMMDPRITLGTGKLLSVLALEAQHDQLAGCAPGFQPIRGIAVAVSPAWSGARRADLRERVSSVVGRPAADLQDGGSALKQAVDVLRERGLGRPVLDDLSHAGANMRKRRDETPPQFAPFLSAGGRGASRLKHTVLACLSPPKVHTTARCMTGHRLGRWADRGRGLWPASRARTDSVGATLRACLDALPACRPLIRQCRADAVALLACQKMRKTRGLTHDTLSECEPVLDPGHRSGCARSLPALSPQQLETATRLGLDAVGLPISADPIASLLGLTKQHGGGPVKDANRRALRLPARCGLPTPEAAQQGRELTVAQHRARTDGLASLTTHRRQIRANPHNLEQLGSGRDQGNVALLPPGKDRADRANLLSLPKGYKEVEGPLPQLHAVSPTQATGVGNQVQNPVKGRTPI